jgi:FtsP/CotA-like multicopper oxidase with cupredoxin domain
MDGTETSKDPRLLNRRSFLNRGALGVAGAALLGAGTVAPGEARAAPGPGTDATAKNAKNSAGAGRPWPDRPPGWWRHQHDVIHPAAVSGVNYREVELSIEIVKHEVVPGYSFHALGFNGQVPGPELRFKEGEWVKVFFTNKTELLHTIHWHGVDLQYENDGVPYATQHPVMPNQTFEYRFQAIPGGTRFYHCHFGTLLHMQHAMHGALIIEPEHDPIKQEFGYTRDYTLVLSSFDTNFARDDLNFMLERMKQRMWLMSRGELDSKTLAVFDSLEDMFKAIDEGWDPPYLPNRNQRRSAAQIDHNFFAINGKGYPLTEKLMIKRGETIRVRLVNGGGLVHNMHLHGHQFWHVAQDGNLLHAPVQLNTVPVGPGQTVDIIIEGYNPGYWTFHDHDTSRVTNNGMYPGGMLTLLVYEEMADYDGYHPKIALDE